MNSATLSATISNLMNSLNKLSKILKVNKFHCIVFFLLLPFFVLETQAQEKPDFDNISVVVQIEGLNYTYNIAALYATDGKLYVSVEELFQVVIIPCIVNPNGEVLSGFIENEKRPYEINFQSKQIKFDAKTYPIENTMIKNMGMLYLESSVFEKAFGLHLFFNFRSLSIKVTSDFELPILKKQRQEKSRNIIQNTNEEHIADQIIKRDYHLFRYGTMDWSVMSSQSPNTPIDSRIGLNLGTELLFGEADAFLNFSDKNKPDPRQQQFYWRWVDNEKKIIRQVLAGNVSNKTISSINAPVHGAVFTNTPTTVRKAKGEYTITDVTQPDWVVELYINNALVSFTKADAAGQFSFKVPIVYGYTVLKLKFYGPMGEEKLEEKVMNVPASFMPSGVFEYKIGGGLLQDGNNTILARGEGNYGVNRSFTIGGGVEYLSSLSKYNVNYIPFVSFSMLPISKLILSGEYADKVRAQILMNYYIFSNAMLEIEYAKYTEGQKAIMYNYLEERKIGLSLPVRFKSISGSTRISYKQNVFKSFNYNMVELTFSSFYKQYNVNISSNANWITDKPLYINASAAFSVRMSKGFSLRPSAQFNLSKMEILSYKAELEKKISQAGYFSVSFERNIVSDFNSVNLSFKYDLSFAQTNISSRLINKDISLLESVRGGIAIDDKNARIFASQQSMVGRGGFALLAYVDLNHNNVYDPGERKADFLSVKVNGGKAVYSEKDSLVRVMGLEPFLYYNVELDDKDFEFITWRIMKKNLSVMVDPNQFKTIEVPISPVAEISGNVLYDNGLIQEGLGRVIVNIFNKDGSLASKIITESDGYVNYLGLLPGEYTAKIDSVQLFRLQMKASPAVIKFNIKAMIEGDVFNGLEFVLRNNKNETLGLVNTDSLKSGISLDTNVLQRKMIKDFKEDPTDLLIAEVAQKIQFEVGKASFNPVYKPYLQKIAQLLEKQPAYTLVLEGLCDMDGSLKYNQKLSLKRATAVRNELIKLGVDGKRIEVVGIASLRPINTDTSKAGKTFNRRVDFSLRLKDTTSKQQTQPIGNLNLNNTLKDGVNKLDEMEQMLGNSCNQTANYYIQCGVFKNKNAALQFALKLKSKTDIAVGIEVVKGSYKVQLACSADKTEIEKTMRQLKEKKICDSMFIGIRK